MMKPSSHTMLVVLCIGFINASYCLSFTINTSAYLCSYDQSHALMEFKNNFAINRSASDSSSPFSYPRTNSWSENQDCCYWDGVTCDTTTSQVIGLDLSSSWLQGQLTSNNSLFLLQHLQILNLADNDFIRSEISSWFSQFRRLTLLNLSYSNFLGQVPTEISYLSNLVSLDLSTFRVPHLRCTRLTMKSLVQNLTNLQELHLRNVNLSSVGSDSLRNISSSLKSLVLSRLKGIFPTSIFHLPNLQILRLFGSLDLKVSLPTSNWNTSLIELRFSQLQFIKGLPSSIGNLKSLKYLDTYTCGISGSIPYSIGNLTNLEHLDLSYNELGDSIPASFGYLLGHLQYLNLSYNKLVGSLPSFSNISLLHTLKLWRNSFNGTIPFSLYSLPLLRNLDLSFNQFTGGQLHPFRSRVVETIDLSFCGLEGRIPYILFPYGANELISLDFSFNFLNDTIPSSLFTLPSLLLLDLGYNQLVGHMPEFKSTFLQEIYLPNNKLQGNISSSIFGLNNLTKLYFSSNNLSGTIDTSMFLKLQSLIDFDGSNNNLWYTINMNPDHSLPNLKYFYFSSNNMTEFPTFLRGSKVLSYLDLSNNKIGGRVPDWLWDVGRDTLNYLNLAHNKLTRIDKLPWKNLEYLDMRSNLLRGPLILPPHELVTYFISNNSLAGDIPTLICKTSFMEALDLSRNKFTGTIPECLGNISTLIVLDLSMNKLHGRILNFSEHNNRSSLRTLNLNGNQLEGKLSKSLVNCEKLEVLDIGNNNINDTFPHWLRILTKLQVLVLRSNHFHGYINDYKYQNRFKKLRIFDLSNNNFVGHLPAKYIQDLKDMQVGINGSQYMEHHYGGFTVFESYYRDVNSYYQDTITQTIKGREIKFEKILRIFMIIDFSENKFKGEIPQVIGTLIFLKSLNLSYNNLFGHIPSSIGNLRNLESLDLSSNKLDGTIPRELASLGFLGKLNLSQNALVGPIPSTNNFDTKFDNNSYQGNLALCGPPLSKKCGAEKLPPILHEVDDSDDDDFDRKIILYGYFSGFVIGLSIGYIVFSGELPIWLAKMVVHYYRLSKLKGRTQQPRGRN